MSDIVKFKDVEQSIIKVRDQNVILDSDVAKLYGVETMRINEAVKNNPDKFPEGYVLQLTKKDKEKVIEIFDNPKIKFSPVMPKAFTEKGLYMLATILKSEQATQTTIAIVETFTQIRDLQRTVAQLSNNPDESIQKQLMQKSGDIMADILGSELQTTDTETTFKLNLAVLSFEHKIKRK